MANGHGGARTGAGRKPIGEESKNSYIHIRISETDKTKIYELARNAGMTIGDFIVMKCTKE